MKVNFNTYNYARQPHFEKAILPSKEELQDYFENEELVNIVMDANEELDTWTDKNGFDVTFSIPEGEKPDIETRSLNAEVKDLKTGKIQQKHLIPPYTYLHFSSGKLSPEIVAYIYGKVVKESIVTSRNEWLIS